MNAGYGLLVLQFVESVLDFSSLFVDGEDAGDGERFEWMGGGGVAALEIERSSVPDIA